MAKGRR